MALDGSCIANAVRGSANDSLPTSFKILAPFSARASDNSLLLANRLFSGGLIFWLSACPVRVAFQLVAVFSADPMRLRISAPSGVNPITA
jgi:hypothetical protein